MRYQICQMRHRATKTNTKEISDLRKGFVLSNDDNNGKTKNIRTLEYYRLRRKIETIAPRP